MRSACAASEWIESTNRHSPINHIEVHIQFCFGVHHSTSCVVPTRGLRRTVSPLSRADTSHPGAITNGGACRVDENLRPIGRMLA